MKWLLEFCKAIYDRRQSLTNFKSRCKGLLPEISSSTGSSCQYTVYHHYTAQPHSQSPAEHVFATLSTRLDSSQDASELPKNFSMLEFTPVRTHISPYVLLPSPQLRPHRKTWTTFRDYDRKMTLHHKHQQMKKFSWGIQRGKCFDCGNFLQRVGVLRNDRFSKSQLFQDIILHEKSKSIQEQVRPSL